MATSVIDLRALTEDRGFDQKAAVEGLGMSYVNLPVAGAGGGADIAAALELGVANGLGSSLKLIVEQKLTEGRD